jgi:GNAT superfamily N-acetyltransferase
MAEKSNNATITVRKMNEGDLAKINAVDNSLRGKKRVTTWPFSFDTYWRVYEPKLCYVAEMKGQVVGFIAGVIENEERSKYLLGLPRTMESPLEDNPKIGWIEMMGVHGEFWGKGIGLALMEAFTAECKKNNASVRIVIRDDDEALKAFLAGRGFNKAEFVSYEKKMN